MAKNNSELHNLKTIHKIQSGGEIQTLLNQLRAGKSTLDVLMKSVNHVKKQKEQSQQEQQTQQASSKPQASAETQQQSASAGKISIAPIENEVKQPQSQGFKTQHEGFNQNRSRDFSKTAQQRPQTKQGDFQNRQTRSFDQRQPRHKDHQQGQQRQFGQGQQRQFGQGQPRQFDSNNRATGVAFASSRSNAKRVFEPQLESSLSLAQPERNYGNKNKSKRNYDDKDKANRRAAFQSSGRRSNTVIGENFEEIRLGSRKLIKNKKKEKVNVAPAITHAVITGETCTVKMLSEKIGKPAAEIIKKLMILGVMATINSSIDFTTAELVASELGVTLEQKLELTAEQELSQTASINQDDEKDSVPRPPVVAVMGHVDHGKTSLLDILRKSSVAEGEAGGITQSIGAYQISAGEQKITFLDTPGHAAFTSMRARGAKVTDVAILVVAADDGIMPQTIEAINHIKAAEVPMIVAINKMDKKEANPERIKTQLSEHGLLPEEWGGDTVLVPVSAKVGTGIDELLNMILLVSQMQDLKANPNRLAFGTVIEASLDKARGPLATVLVQNGTLKIGDTIVCGITYGKVKAMYDEKGNTLKQAPPSTPVSVLGLNEVPQSGDQVYVVDEKLSKQVIQERKSKIKTEKTTQSSAVSLEGFMDKVNEGKLKNLNLIIKADSQGSIEALKQSLMAVSNEEVRVVCVHSGVGQITESDLVLAQASSSLIVNFNLKIDNKIKILADSMSVEIRDYNVIYEVVEEITNSAKNMREKVYEKVVIGHAEVRKVFKLSSYGTIAGSYVTDGKVARNSGARVMRDGEEIADTSIIELKIHKDDKAEVNYGYECGIKLKDFADFKEGDIIEAYQNVEVKM